MTDLCCNCNRFSSCPKKDAHKFPVTGCNEYQPVASVLSYKSLRTVQEVFDKWFYMTTKAKYLLELELAVYLSNELYNTPIWVFVKGASGDLKTAMIMSFLNAPKVILMNKPNDKALVSGQKNAQDIGYKLNGRHRVLIIPDMSSIFSMRYDDKVQFFGDMRNAYDGFLQRELGTGTKTYTDFTVSIIANATYVIDDQYLLANELGTREFMFDTDANKKDNITKMKKASENEEQEQKLKEEITEAVHGFLAHHTIKQDMEIPDEIMEFLREQATILAVLRTHVPIDKYSGEVINIPHPEVPTRLIKQFKRLYKAIMSLDENYSESRFKNIVRHIVISSCDKMRMEAYKIFQNSKKERASKVARGLTDAGEIRFSIRQISDELRVGWKTSKTLLDKMWALEILEIEIDDSNPKYPKYKYYLPDSFKWSK